MNFVQCLHIVLVIGKYTDVFRKNFFSGGGGAGGGDYSGESFRGGCFFGVRDISMKGAPDFQTLFKNNQKLN